MTLETALAYEPKIKICDLYEIASQVPMHPDRKLLLPYWKPCLDCGGKDVNCIHHPDYGKTAR